MARLSFLLAEASSGVAAIDKWHELLRTAGLYEYEPAAGEDTLVYVGEPRCGTHTSLYTLGCRCDA